MSILVINSGSSSLRLSLFSQHAEKLSTLAEVHHDNVDEMVASLLSDFLALCGSAKVSLIVHRVVHGGEKFTAPQLIDSSVEAEIERLVPLAPLHNSRALFWIQLARATLQGVPQLAIFDTAFYRFMPAVATTYALPHELCQLYGIRRYGFHGIAHRAMCERWRKIRSRDMNECRLITLQLGAGCSISATKLGEVVDTSMGFSPLEGLVMASRSGDLDPGVICFLQREVGLDVTEIDRMLNKQSGLLGLSGESSDMRVLLDSDKPESQLAVEIYCYRVRKYIGAYSTVLGGIDAIIFGGGVGQNSSRIREKIIAGLEWMGPSIDAELNDSCRNGKEECISPLGYETEVWVMPVDEARVMAHDALAFLGSR